MPKPYSQDLRDRVIDAVERGGMSRRAAARRYEISKSVVIKWVERFERDGRRTHGGQGGLSGGQAEAASVMFCRLRGPRRRI